MQKMDTFGKKIRDEMFFLDKETAFTNHGSYGTVPKPVFEAHQNLLLSVERNVNKWFMTDLQVQMWVHARRDAGVLPNP